MSAKLRRLGKKGLIVQKKKKNFAAKTFPYLFRSQINQTKAQLFQSCKCPVQIWWWQNYQCDGGIGSVKAIVVFWVLSNICVYCIACLNKRRDSLKNLMGKNFSFKFLTWLRWGLARRRYQRFASSIWSPEFSRDGEHKKIIQNIPLQNNAKCSMLIIGSECAEWNISIRNTNKSEKNDLWRFFTQLEKDISNLEKNLYSWDQIRWIPDWWIESFQLSAVISISTWFGTNIRLSSWRLMWQTLKRENLYLSCIC